MLPLAGGLLAKKEPAAKSEPAIEAVATLRSPFRKVFMVVVVFSTPLQTLLQQRFHITCLGELESVGIPPMTTPTRFACIH